MKLPLYAFAFLSLTLANACKKNVTVGHGGGGEAGQAEGKVDEGDGAAAADGKEGEEVVDEGGGDEEAGGEETVESSSEEKFSLVKFLKSRTEPDLEEIKMKVNPETTLLIVGERNRFSLETNTTMGVAPSTDESAPDERKIESKFWVDAYMFDKKVKNIGASAINDKFMEASSTAILDHFNFEAVYRYLGVDVSTKTITAGWEPRYTRDNEVKFGANVVVVGAEVSLRMGGEVAVKFEFGVRRDDVLNIVFQPQAHITAGVSGQIKLLGGLGSAGPKGVTKMMEYMGRGNANLGLIPSSKLLYADIGIDPGAMIFTDGKVDIVASSLGRDLWTKNVYDPKPLIVKKIPQFGASIVRFIKKPESAEACKAATDEAEKILTANKAVMVKYKAAVAEEDQPVITASLARMDEILGKVPKACSEASVIDTVSNKPAEMPAAMPAAMPAPTPAPPALKVR